VKSQFCFQHQFGQRKAERTGYTLQLKNSNVVVPAFDPSQITDIDLSSMSYLLLRKSTLGTDTPYSSTKGDEGRILSVAAEIWHIDIIHGIMHLFLGYMYPIDAERCAAVFAALENT
jgi:hypothetical protein